SSQAPDGRGAGARQHCPIFGQASVFIGSSIRRLTGNSENQRKGQRRRGQNPENQRNSEPAKPRTRRIGQESREEWVGDSRIGFVVEACLHALDLECGSSKKPLITSKLHL
ncbi:hypothetical protein Dimus_031647, partial [Dionaea muscipula]